MLFEDTLIYVFAPLLYVLSDRKSLESCSASWLVNA